MPTYIYHITKISNLPQIIANGGLLSKNAIQAAQLTYDNIAHQSIQDQREYTVVPCAAGGNLHDYIPFYFAPRSPMLYTINRGNVIGYDEGQEPIVYLVSTAEIINDSGNRFAFTDGHGIMLITEFFDDLRHLNEIDWDIMKARYWSDTDDDPDRKRRRQAEFLVYNLMEWNWIIGIVVLNDNRKRQAEQMIAALNHKPQVHCLPDWYY